MEKGRWERRRGEALKRAGISKEQIRNEREAENQEMLETSRKYREKRKGGKATEGE